MPKTSAIDAPPIINQQYELVPITELKRHPRNARSGDVGAIHQSIEANGFFGACVVQRSTRYVLAGNHRLIAANEAGIAEIPVIWIDCDDDRALRILLADNKTSDDANYDSNKLADLLTELATSSDGLTGTGYSGDELDDLLKDLGRMPGMPQTQNDTTNPVVPSATCPHCGKAISLKT